MNKKLMVFGVLGLFAMGLVVAALVGYVSNSVETEVVVSHPIKQEISTDNSIWEVDDSIEFGIYGGESITFYVKDTNLANVATTAVPENRVTNEGVTCADFESVLVTTTTKIEGEADVISGPWDLIALSLCSKDGDDVVFSYGPNPLTWATGQEDTSEIVATFKTDALGTYTFTSNILPVTAE